MKRSRAARLAVAGLVVPALFLTGCSGAPRPNSAESAVDIPRGLATTPAGQGEVDTVKWNIETGEPTSLDWIYAYDDSSNLALANMCEGLIRQNEDLSLSPALAEKIDHPDALTTVFTLRQGVTFWDGTPLTTDDVAFSLNRHLEVDAGSYWGVPFYDNVESITASSATDVTVRFSQPDSLFERMLGTAAGVIGSKAFVETQGEAYGTAQGGIMCTGPFAFDSWRSGTSIAMTKNEKYWDPELVPLVKQLTLSFVTDETTITNSLVSGDLDGTYATPLSATETLAKSTTGTLSLGISQDWMAIRPTEKIGPMQNLAVRQALSLLLDRDTIAKTVFRGTATASLTPIQPGAWGYETDAWQAAFDALPAPVFDVAAATKLIADNDLTGTSLTIAMPADSEAEAKTAEILGAAAKQAGLDLTFTTMPTTSFTELYFDEAARAGFDAFFVQEYGAGVGDPVVSMSEFTPLSAYNYGAYDDPVLTDSVRQALSTTDDAARAELLINGQKRLVEDLPLITIVTPEHRVYMNDRITGATASRAALYYPWAANIGTP
ncbi:ABC transporter substrate-binding protein [Glaciibacter psychrotolerans]|uniref:Peptide/nickel transport system substrate-binding protein n=1 Tax=Glaciibacter psychrotolerans TaxID=670054 RepID=A0A7Z0EGZ2_9MICO|nr:ABC transporter substrate-binding protein [Leifsonia psychrotolerans]NYJ21070.1 peptide/nickel transport system substrate-binding protein [Leifsonia psychrotolerans]